LDMNSDHALFRNSSNSNLCSFESQTCCQSMKNPKRQLDVLFGNVFFSDKLQAQSQQERLQ
jgi:hypothetical protein